MRIRVEFNRRYTGVHCAFCDRRIHDAPRRVPGWLSEWVGKVKFWRHSRGSEHQSNRPAGGLAAAPVINMAAFECAWCLVSARGDAQGCDGRRVPSCGLAGHGQDFVAASAPSS